MTTLKQVQQEIADLMREGNAKDVAPARKKKIQKRLEYLRPLAVYLETDPPQELVERQLKEEERKLQLAIDGFAAWLKNTPATQIGDKPLKTYETVVGTKSLKAKVKTLKYLLNL